VFKIQVTGIFLPEAERPDVPHRLILLPRRDPQAPWRDTRAEAVEDAVRLQLAERDEVEPGRVWWHPLAEIETQEG
jgi:hypothetical protein